MPRDSRWISVKEKLPEILEQVLICHRSPHWKSPLVYSSYLEDEGSCVKECDCQEPYDCDHPYKAFWHIEGDSDEVTHWMELPEPPVEATDAKG